jgi:hypothetical protein
VLLNVSGILLQTMVRMDWLERIRDIDSGVEPEWAGCVGCRELAAEEWEGNMQRQRTEFDLLLAGAEGAAASDQEKIMTSRKKIGQRDASGPSRV